MILFKQASTLHNYLKKLKINGQSIGFVPTMGALHKGHESLIQTSKNDTDITVCSVFVNPTQFNDQKDYEKYPVTISQDILKLEHLNCDVLFLPSVEEMYPGGTTSAANYDLQNIDTILEGHYRPGHFQGVCQVVDRLLHIVTPDKIFMGQKDYQQLLVIKKLVNLIQLPVEVITCPTLREASGLAMSSRNVRLTELQKEHASSLYQMLMHIRNNIASSPLPVLEKYGVEYLLKNGFEKVDYVSIADARTLSPVSQAEELTPLAVLAAAFIGGVRLIDNVVIAS